MAFKSAHTRTWGPRGCRSSLVSFLLHLALELDSFQTNSFQTVDQSASMNPASFLPDLALEVLQKELWLLPTSSLSAAQLLIFTTSQLLVLKATQCCGGSVALQLEGPAGGLQCQCYSYLLILLTCNNLLLSCSSLLKWCSFILLFPWPHHLPWQSPCHWPPVLPTSCQTPAQISFCWSWSWSPATSTASGEAREV